MIRSLSLVVLFCSFPLFLLGQDSSSDFSTCDVYDGFNQVPTDWTIIDDNGGSTPRMFIQSNSTDRFMYFDDAPSRDGIIRAYKPLSLNLCSAWKASCDFEANAIGTDPTRGAGHFILAFTEKNRELITDINLQDIDNDMIGLLLIGGNSQGLGISLVTSINSMKTYIPLTPLGYVAMNVTYRGYMERIDSINVHVTVVKNSNQDTVLNRSVQIPNGLDNNFSYLQIGCTTNSWETRRLTGKVDNICIANCHNSISIDELDVQVSNSLKVYPNPVQSRIFIDDLPEPCHRFQISSINGQVIVNQNFSESQPIDVDMLTPGVYILQLYSGSGKMYTSRFVKAPL